MRRTRELGDEYVAVVAVYSRRDGNHGKTTLIMEDGRYKKLDVLSPIPYRTMFISNVKSYENALTIARKAGTVISCRKIDPSYRLNKIEHLNLHQEITTIDVVRRRVFVTPDVEVVSETHEIVAEKIDKG